MPEFDPSAIAGMFNEPQTIEGIVQDLRTENQKFRDAYPELTATFDAIDEAVNRAAEDVPSYAQAVAMAAIAKKTVEETHAAPVLSIDEMNERTRQQLAKEISIAQRGRLESDIPFDDPYWAAKNTYNTFSMR